MPGAGAGHAIIAGGGDGGGSLAGANFTLNGAAVAGTQAGYIQIQSGKGDGTFTARGGTAPGAEGGLIDVYYEYAIAEYSDQTVLIAEAGADGGLGGTIQVEASTGLKMSQFQVFGNGRLDLTPLVVELATIGSLEGDGQVFLGGNKLGLGRNNRSTTFSGIIQDSGSVTKTGTATLTLTGANTYTGGTTIDKGRLVVNNTTGSGTGTGAVQVNAGRLSGGGVIAGAVTVGAGSGAGAFLVSSLGKKPGALTIQSSLTFQADGTYSYVVNTRTSKADEVIANGTSIDPNALFSLLSLGNRRLATGTVFTAINNTAATAIAGTFSNLPDEGTITAGKNTFQADYESGDGNDLTLTVVP